MVHIIQLSNSWRIQIPSAVNIKERERERQRDRETERERERERENTMANTHMNKLSL